jgi:pimeloyl-ACP methyl ester carboxylesterase
MYFRYKEIDVFYQRKKGEGTPVLLLHGWGCSHKTLQSVFDFYASLGKEIIAIDFPPFGSSCELKEPFKLEDYALMTLSLLSLLGLEKVEIFAHSFGARVAALINEKVTVTRLVITGGAGVKRRKSLKAKWRIVSYKLRKKLGLSTKKFGSTDYQALSPIMQKTFVSIVNRYTDDELKKITAPTLLIWGENDKETPLSSAKKMKKIIPTCELITLPNCGHFAFFDDSRTFFAVLLAFCGDKV